MARNNAGPWFRKDEEYNIIPRNLLPKTTNKITLDWSRKTYKYFHCFEPSVTSKIINNDEDLRTWQAYAIKLMTELKALGLAEARNEIVRVALNTFRIDLTNNKKNKKKAIETFDDVAALFEDEEWYFEDEDYNRRMLYVFQYGIFRNGYNGWLHTTALNWMEDYKITYEDPVELSTPSTVPKPKTKKGFVLELLHIKASNTIQDRFLRTTRKHLGQHLLCRKKIPDTLPNESSPKLLTFNNYNAYLIVNSNHRCYVERHQVPPETKVKESVKYAITNGMSQEKLLQLVASCYGDQSKLYIIVALL